MPKPNDTLLVDKFANDLRGRIEKGEYGTAGVIPSVSDLASMWGTKNRAVVAEVIMLLRVQGYLVQTPKRHYRVVHPRIVLEGLTPNFRSHLESQGFTAEEKDIVIPQVEIMPLDVACMFVRNDTKTPAIKEGIHVIHRVRSQGLTDLPLRIGHIWYPLDIAEPYLNAMRADSSFDFLASLKRDTGVAVHREDFSIRARVPDLAEIKELRLARYQPLLEIRRICYSGDGSVITLHRTIMDATRFEYNLSREVNHWK